MKDQNKEALDYEKKLKQAELKRRVALIKRGKPMPELGLSIKIQNRWLVIIEHYNELADFKYYMTAYMQLLPCDTTYVPKFERGKNGECSCFDGLYQMAYPSLRDLDVSITFLGELKKISGVDGLLCGNDDLFVGFATNEIGVTQDKDKVYGALLRMIKDQALNNIQSIAWENGITAGDLGKLDFDF